MRVDEGPGGCMNDDVNEKVEVREEKNGEKSAEKNALIPAEPG